MPMSTTEKDTDGSKQGKKLAKLQRELDEAESKAKISASGHRLEIKAIKKKMRKVSDEIIEGVTQLDLITAVDEAGHVSQRIEAANGATVAIGEDGKVLKKKKGKGAPLSVERYEE